LFSELPPEVGTGGFEINDKLVHLGLYTVLGAALAWGGGETGRGAGSFLLIIGFSYGAMDEWHQGFVPGRDPSIGDLLADCAGVIVGFLFLRWLLRSRTTGSAERPD
jgi:VanZ family protein